MVVTFSQLGKYGRMGNCLFQIATTMGYAQSVQDKFAFPLWEERSHFNLQGCWLPNLPRLAQIEEKHFHFNELPKKKNVNLHGYFQSYKYFEHCSNLVKTKLTPKIASKIEIIDACSIHVRRTDYLQFHEHHTNLTMDYYDQAMKLVNAKNYIVFSDDIKWCKEAFKKYNNVSFESNHHILDFAKMLKCKHNIIANSSYSWWAAYLNQNANKMIIAPKNWFGPKLASHNTKDLFLPSWKVI